MSLYNIIFSFFSDFVRFCPLNVCLLDSCLLNGGMCLELFVGFCGWIYHLRSEFLFFVSISLCCCSLGPIELALWTISEDWLLNYRHLICCNYYFHRKLKKRRNYCHCYIHYRFLPEIIFYSVCSCLWMKISFFFILYFYSFYL